MMSSKHCLFTGNFSNPYSGDQNLAADSSKPRDTTDLTLLFDFGTSSWNNMKGQLFCNFSSPTILADTEPPIQWGRCYG